MAGPLTAADDYNFEDMDFGVDGVETEDVNVETDPYAVDVSGAVADYTPVYQRAIERLRSQREGMTSRQRLGALLVGFGQPTRSGKWQESLGNASQLLFQQTLAQRERDERRREKLAELESRMDVAGVRTKAQIEAARIRADAAKAKVGATDPITLALGHKPDADERRRIGHALRLFPGKTGQDLVGLLYSPKVNFMMMQAGVAGAAANGGNDPRAALKSVQSAIDVPTLEEFLVTGRADNPGVSDAELTAYYNKEYGGR